VLAKQVLSQLSYTPTVGVPFILKHLPLFSGHHCAQPLVERFGVAATTRANFADDYISRHSRFAPDLHQPDVKVV
jgi:hypothetical protein